MDNISEYQKMRGSNLGRNWQILAELGVKLPNPKSQVVLHKVRSRAKPPAKKRVKPVTDTSNSHPCSRFQLRVRLRTRSLDHAENEERTYEQDSESSEQSDEENEMKQPPREPRFRNPRPNAYGKVEGIKVGDWWRTRIDCSADGVHRPTVAGIHAGPEGAFSVAISGGYEDDVDLGESFTYTGEGGRDLKGTVNNPKNLRTAPQSKDQLLAKGNLALSRNVETGNPVRVIRGYKLNNRFAPVEGYRYDGLYQVKKYWEAVGKAGFKVFKFAFVRCDNEPAPWIMVDHKGDDDTFADTKEPVSDKIKNGIENGDDKSSHKSPKNEPASPNRKTMYFDLSPGVKSPIKVSQAVEKIPTCVVSVSDFMNTPSKRTSDDLSDCCGDIGWLGWEKVDVCEGHCLVVEFESVETKVCLEKDSWKEQQCASESLSLDSTCSDIDSPGPLDWLGWP